MPHQVHFSCGSERALDVVERSLTGLGLSVFRSFDLPSAGACGCEADTGRKCTCRFAVLLVYAESGLPAVVTALGRPRRTVVEVAVNPNAPVDPALIDRTVRAIRAAAAKNDPNLRQGAPRGS